MSVSISIHVDGYYGLKRGVGNILDLLDKYGLKASFFVNMGNEASLFELLRYRSKELGREGKAITHRYSKFQILRMLLFPRKIGAGNFEILKEIKARGHEVEPHCWSHLLWSKNFNGVNFYDEFSNMTNIYKSCFGYSPLGVVPPTWKIDDRVIKQAKNFNFRYISVKNGSKPYLSEGMLFIPLTYPYTPEELINKGFSEEKIINTYQKQLNKKNAHVYFHADYEGIEGVELFDKILALLKGKKTVLLRDYLKLKTHKK